MSVAVPTAMGSEDAIPQKCRFSNASANAGEFSGAGEIKYMLYMYLRIVLVLRYFVGLIDSVR